MKARGNKRDVVGLHETIMETQMATRFTILKNSHITHFHFPTNLTTIHKTVSIPFQSHSQTLKISIITTPQVHVTAGHLIPGTMMMGRINFQAT